MIANGLGHLNEVPIAAASILALPGELDLVSPSLGSARVIPEALAKRRTKLRHASKQPHHHADPIPQQGRVARLVDVALHHGGVPPDRLAPLDAFSPSHPDQDPMDGLPGLRANPLYVGLQRLEARPILEPEAHEAPEGRRVLQMKLELAVAQAMDLLEERNPEHLVARESGAAGVGARHPHHVPMHELPDLWMAIQNLAGRGELLDMRVRAPAGSQRKLDVSEIAHCLTPQIGNSCGDPVSCTTTSYTNQTQNWGGICAYFSLSLTTSEFPDEK